MTRPILLIDAMSLFARHYIRNPSMSVQGHQAGGVVGFMNALRQMIELANPSRVFVVWEGGGSPRRRAIFPEYKANRKPPRLNRYYEDDIPDTSENRLHQIKVLVEVLKNVSVCQMFIEDCEADDVIGYLCRNTFKDDKKIIASSDKDYYQLVDTNAMLYSWSSKRFIGPDEVIAEYNIAPCNFAVAKAICGDPSDGIPGVKGVGFKTLAKRFDLASAEVTLDDLHAQCETKINESDVKVYTQIYENKDLTKRNLRLIYLDTSNLAAVQVRKIDAIVGSFVPKKNKMQLMRTLLDEGLGAFDAHEFFSAFVAI